MKKTFQIFFDQSLKFINSKVSKYYFFGSILDIFKILIVFFLIFEVFIKFSKDLITQLKFFFQLLKFSFFSNFNIFFQFLKFTRNFYNSKLDSCQGHWRIHSRYIEACWLALDRTNFLQL